jgi:DNA-binding HxlR family transcriptional regulator
MAKRSYEQYCPLARALDLLGERWTLLVIRDLLSGPKRYSDLNRGLPGLATDLLTERLRALEEAGIVRRRELPPPAAATVYELTDRGRELEQPIFALARFGLGLLGESPDPGADPRPEQLGLLLRLLFKPERAPSEPETWVFESDGAKLALTVSNEGVTLHQGADAVPDDPRARFIGAISTIYGLVVGRLDVAKARADGRLKVEGDQRALGRMQAAFQA